jgi:hypothetical protein
MIPEEYKPSRVKVVMTSTLEGHHAVVHEDKDFPLAWRTPNMESLYRLLGKRKIRTVIRRANDTYLTWDIREMRYLHCISRPKMKEGEFSIVVDENRRHERV